MGSARIEAGAGNDFVYFDSTSISGNALVQGDTGTDRLERDGTTQFNGSSSILGFENRRGSGGERLLDALFAELERRSAAGDGRLF